MKTLLASALLISVASLVGCATTQQTQSTTQAANSKADAEVITGSRLPRTTTDRLVKSTVQDKADEPVRSMGNVVGGRGR